MYGGTGAKLAAAAKAGGAIKAVAVVGATLAGVAVLGQVGVLPGVQAMISGLPLWIHAQSILHFHGSLTGGSSGGLGVNFQL